jgi:hypothetical protein
MYNYPFIILIDASIQKEALEEENTSSEPTFTFCLQSPDAEGHAIRKILNESFVPLKCFQIQCDVIYSKQIKFNSFVCYL